jgi:hypothetical protein
VVSFTLLPLYPQGKSPGWVGPRADLDNMEERKFLTLSKVTSHVSLIFMNVAIH